MSHPSWVRGLKHAMNMYQQILLASHPSWVRGLKLKEMRMVPSVPYVAPLVGAWIETYLSRNSLS